MLSWITSNQLFIDQTLVDAILVLSFYVAYQAGVFSLGSIGFAAVGAYTTAVLTTAHGFGWVLGVVCGTIVGALMALVIGAIIARLDGIYFALGSFAFAAAIVVIIGELGFTKGQEGIANIPEVRNEWYPLIVLIVSCALLQLVIRSHYGRAFAAVRLDREMARGLGIPAARYRLVAFVLSGGFAALSGAIQAHQITVVSPTEFQFSAIILPLTFVMVGGVESWVGPVVACILLDIFRNWARKAGTDWETLSYGIVLLVAIFLAPKGLTDPVLRHRVLGFARKVIARRQPLLASGGAPAPAGSPAPGRPGAAPTEAGPGDDRPTEKVQ